jgi:CRP/FNR family transcriptional regulator
MNDTPELRQKIFGLFPFLGRAEPDVQAELFAHGSLARLPRGQLLCLEGNKCSCIPLVLQGQARVYKLGESGREITLYRIEPGDSCIMTASCILSGVPFPAFAVTETEVEAVLVQPEELRRWMNRIQVWRNYVFGLLASRLGEVIAVIEEVAFRRVDMRTAEYLINSGRDGGTIKKTHQEIATDLGTSREVVSRILKEFEREGLVALSRGEIRTENAKGLELFAHHLAHNGGGRTGLAH